MAHPWTRITERDQAWRARFVPPEITVDDTMIGMIESGTWTAKITNTESRTAQDVSFVIDVTVATRARQLGSCPQEDWSIFD